MVRWISTVVLTATLLGCAAQGPEPDSTEWLSFERRQDSRATVYKIYFDSDGRYLSCVASGHPTQAEADAFEPGIPADALLRAGPRMVGDIPAADRATLERLNADEPWAIYKSEPSLGAYGSEEDFLTFMRWQGARDRVAFLRDLVVYPETAEMLDTLLEMHHRLHLAGDFFNASDAELAAQENWPVP